jgi:excisionase family DNA binding protein
MEKLWTTAEVAQFLGITEVDVEGLVRQGKLTGYRLGGQFLRFRPDEVGTLKGAIRFRPNSLKRGRRAQDPWYAQVRDFVYFYDFYILSATFLAALVVYLIASG